MKTTRPRLADLIQPKELSWLQFNQRVLEEARSERHPLWDRLRFLAIYSNNLDEFYRVRVAGLRRLEEEEGPAHKVCGRTVRQLLREIRSKVGSLTDRFEETWVEIDEEMERENVLIVDETHLSPEQAERVRAIFQREVRSRLVPILLVRGRDIPLLHDHVLHLAIQLDGAAANAPQFALIEIPTDTLPRFWTLPPVDGKQSVILLEDIVRFGLREVFSLFTPKAVRAWAFKVTRDAELDLDQSVVEGYLRRVHQGLKKRATGKPVRMVHDRGMPDALLTQLLRKLDLTRADARIPGMRYHNFKDFMKFPKLGRPSLASKAQEPLPHPELAGKERVLSVAARKDVLLHFPYHSFDHFLDLLREAAIDPAVTHIRLTVYRVSQESSVLNALINAARNGKKVTVLLEVLARFDESNNIEWADYLRDEGVEVILGVRGLKVHSKLCLITRREGRKSRHVAIVGTGNFNEETARIYTDHMLLTADPAVADEVAQVFEFFRNNYKVPAFKQLIVSPFGSRDKLLALMETERRNAKAGKDAWINLRLNNLADEELIEALSDCSRAGVKVRLLVRGMNAMVPGVAGLSDAIEARCLVGRYLEHSRVLMFANAGKPLVYITSADWMGRNMDGRVEVTCPIRDKKLRKELLDYFELQWRDTVNARVWDEHDAERRVEGDVPEFDAQIGIREWLSSSAG
jgi:polyphosphate kinase